MSNQAAVEFRGGDAPLLYMEYVKRTGTFSMTDNHFHPYYELYVLLSGERVYFIKDRSYQVRAGDLVFIGPNELHKTLHAGEPAHERLVIHFDDSWLRTMANSHADLLLEPFRQDSRVLRLPGNEQTAIDSVLLRALQEMRTRPPGYALHLNCAVLELALQASRAAHLNLHRGIDPATPLQQKISDIARYLNEHYARPVTLDSLSEMFYMSPYYISRMFKEVTGFSFVRYLNLIRVKEAQRLLHRTDMKITDVALSVGFDNFSHFGKTFKTIAHMTPREYRKQPALR